MSRMRQAYERNVIPELADPLDTSVAGAMSGESERA